MSLRRNALLLIVLAGALGILGQWSASASLARVWALPAALLLLGLAYEMAAAGRCPLEVELLAPERWPLGRSMPVRFIFRQQTRHVVAIQVALSAPGEFAAEPRSESLELAPGLAVTACVDATPRRLGRFEWPATSVRLGGRLGLAWWPRRAAAGRGVAVVPDVAGSLEYGFGSQRGGGQRGRGTGSGVEILQLREYRPGDALRAVDWKASARRGRLISRDFVEDQHLEIMVAIDAGRASGLGAGALDRLGLYVNVAARFAERAAALDDAVGVLVFAAQPLAMLAPARGDAAVMRIRRALASCRPQPSEANPVLAAAHVRATARRRTLVILLTDLDEPSAREQLAEAVRLLRPKHFPFVAGFESDRIAALAQARTRDPLGAYRALAAVEHTNTVAANVRALRALGAAALTARPERLDAAVLAAYREFRHKRRV